MTLKELFDRCDFTDIATNLKRFNPEQAATMTRFKEAFDTLRNLEPKLDTEYSCYQAIELSKSYYDEFEKEEGGCDYYISVSCGGDYWVSDLAKEIILADELTLTDSEIAAHCLWEMTFYGNPYNDDEFAKTSLRIIGEIDTSNPYAVAAEKLSQKQTDNYLPKQFKEYRGKDALPLEVWDLIWRRRKNRSKRKRDYRQDKRIKTLEHMAIIEDIIQRLTAKTESFSRAELKYLFNAKLISERRYRSRSYDVGRRIDYLVDLITNYESNNFSDYTHFLLMFRTSSDYPLDQRELEVLQNLFSHRLPASANIRYGYGCDEKLETEVGILLICS